jgi:hypothetical protein
MTESMNIRSAVLTTRNPNSSDDESFVNHSESDENTPSASGLTNTMPGRFPGVPPSRETLRNTIWAQHQQDSRQSGDTSTNTQSLTSRGWRNTTLAAEPSRPPASRETHEHMVPGQQNQGQRILAD